MIRVRHQQSERPPLPTVSRDVEADVTVWAAQRPERRWRARQAELREPEVQARSRERPSWIRRWSGRPQ
ncbi:hypothetical protein GCM10011401_03100 [Nesterenkonia cremea]|uniref:Uncharacterized protein n=1 Tax=Nesterenkonia cremea TaxID=1882340 RepID=A0A917ENH0_9MICC|nr:hypothetical protein GCM10011401_03100 [Nesterenkonia cremea]